MGGDLLHALVWLGVGIVTTFLSTRYALGSLSDPGPGSLPFALGLVFILLALVFVVQSLRTRPLRYKTESLPSGMSGVGLKKLGAVVAVLALCAVLFEPVGYIATLFLLVAVSMVLMEPRRWKLALFTGIACSFGCYVIFDLWLKVQLPRGIFHP